MLTSGSWADKSASDDNGSRIFWPAAASNSHAHRQGGQGGGHEGRGRCRGDPGAHALEIVETKLAAEAKKLCRWRTCIALLSSSAALLCLTNSSKNFLP
eukprot:2387332-Alexandrium_andersonii.AAC.1